MNEKFEIGDIVMLRSDGPAMTITSIDKDNVNFVTCTWFNACTIQKAEFPVQALKRLTPLA